MLQMSSSFFFFSLSLYLAGFLVLAFTEQFVRDASTVFNVEFSSPAAHSAHTARFLRSLLLLRRIHSSCWCAPRERPSHPLLIREDVFRA